MNYIQIPKDTAIAILGDGNAKTASETIGSIGHSAVRAWPKTLTPALTAQLLGYAIQRKRIRRWVALLRWYEENAEKEPVASDQQ